VVEQKEDAMKVCLEYYREITGKWYADGEYETKLLHMYEIFREVRKMRDARILPGLVREHSKYIVRVEVPGHDANCPHLIV